MILNPLPFVKPIPKITQKQKKTKYLKQDTDYVYYIGKA